MASRLKSTREEISIKTPGKHSLGGNVILQVSKTGARSRFARLTDHSGRRREFGLGSCRALTLADARQKMRIAKTAVASGNDAELALNPRPTPTFEGLARKVHAEQTSTFRNDKHCAQWITSLETYAFPYVGQLPIEKVTSAHVLEMLRPIWLEKEETASRVLQRVAKVVSYAVPEGYRDSELAVNGIRATLPRQSGFVKHHAAVPNETAALTYSKLEEQECASSKALRFLILTAARSGEVRGTTWEEIDLEQRCWTIPASRMKSGREHRVPPSKEAIELVASLPERENPEELLFPNSKGRALSDTAVSKILKRVAPGCTVHGWRPTFKNWARYKPQFPDELSQLALAHVQQDKTRAAYARDDLLELRRALMDEWAVPLCPDQD